MAKKKSNPRKFSAVKAVKANARERVGQPKPARVIDDAARANRHDRKHKQPLGELLDSEE
ncbi:MAG TPA: hypothetical protein VHX11_02920 [Acidobacteriaceae bacterium]|nr:hypothetical protein [Acidobacteriaceae bacterium]